VSTKMSRSTGDNSPPSSSPLPSPSSPDAAATATPRNAGSLSSPLCAGEHEQDPPAHPAAETQSLHWKTPRNDPCPPSDTTSSPPWSHPRRQSRPDHNNEWTRRPEAENTAATQPHSRAPPTPAKKMRADPESDHARACAS